jgi:hypothetical protein
MKTAVDEWNFVISIWCISNMSFSLSTLPVISKSECLKPKRKPVLNGLGAYSSPTVSNKLFCWWWCQYIFFFSFLQGCSLPTLFNTSLQIRCWEI